MVTLIERILQGDEHAVVHLYHTYSSKILRYLKRYLPDEEAKEICNDVFLEAIDALPTLKKESNVQAWLYKIAHNKIVDFYRKKKITSFILSKIPLLTIIAKEIDEPEFQFEKNRVRDKIEATLHQLSEKYQKVLRLHYEEQIPVKELAGVFNLSFKATESLLYRARKEFQSTYERT